MKTSVGEGPVQANPAQKEIKEACGGLPTNPPPPSLPHPHRADCLPAHKRALGSEITSRQSGLTTPSRQFMPHLLHDESRLHPAQPGLNPPVARSLGQHQGLQGASLHLRGPPGHSPGNKAWAYAPFEEGQCGETLLDV